jgi:cytochrome c556
MKKTCVCMLAVALLAAGCSKEKNAEPAKPAPTTVHEFMIERIDPDADAIWAIGNAAISEDASIDPAKMSDKDWTDLKAAADRMAGHARALENLDPVLVIKPGMKIADEGTEGAPTPAMIQAHLEKDTDVFRALADSLTTHGTDLSAAAGKKDAVTAGRLINEMDGVCESCHLEFWYPDQKELVEQYLDQPS